MKRNFKKKTFLRLQALLLGLMILIGFAPFQLVFAATGVDRTNDPNAVGGRMEISYTLKDGTVKTFPPNVIEDINQVEKFSAHYFFDVIDVEDAATGTLTRVVKPGDFLWLELPERVEIKNPPSGNLLGNKNEPIAAYKVIKDPDSGNWGIKIEFTDYVGKVDERGVFSEEEIHGDLKFDFQLDASGLGPGTGSTISIPIGGGEDIEIEIKNPPLPTVLPAALGKEPDSANYNKTTRALTWNVTASSETAGKNPDLEGWTFTDTINTELLEFVGLQHGGELVQGVDYTYAAGKISYTIPAGKKDNPVIKVLTKVKASVYENYTVETDIRNTAKLSKKVGGEDKEVNSNEASFKVKPNWLTKKGEQYHGNKILWTLTANEDRQNIHSGVITDVFSPELTLDTATLRINEEPVTWVAPGGEAPAAGSEIYAVYDDSIKTLKIFLPRGPGVSNASYTVTYVTDITDPPAEVGPAAPEYENHAWLTVNYPDGAGTGGVFGPVDLGLVGREVPYVWLGKSGTFSDKSKGEITWTIQAASNLASYGKSVITDTLPTDQRYIKVEYLDGGAYKELWPDADPSITAPVPAAAVSGDKLTITFNDGNALASIKEFRVTAKIAENIYGTKLDKRIFTNSAAVNIYDTTDPKKSLANGSDTATVEVTNRVIVKAVSAYASYNPAEGLNPRVNYTIDINENRMPLTNVTVTDDLSRLETRFQENNTGSYVTVNGVRWKLVPGSLKVTRTGGTNDGDFTNTTLSDATFTYLDNETSNLLTVNMGTRSDAYKISFTMELDVNQNAVAKEMFQKNGRIDVRNNRASISAGGLVGAGVNSNTVNSAPINNYVLYKVLNSQSDVNKDDLQIVWTIRLNQHRVTLQNTRVVDVLPKGLTLDPTSVKLYENVIDASGNFKTDFRTNAANPVTPVADFVWTYKSAADAGKTGPDMEGRYVLTVKLPENNKDYILRFATDVDSSLVGKEVSNSAFYEGEEEEVRNGSVGAATISGSAGGGSTSKWSFVARKQDAETGALVARPESAAARFALYWLPDRDDYDSKVFMRELPATDGTVIFRGLAIGQAYLVQEVKAPGGYNLDSGALMLVEGTTGGSVVFANSPIKTGSWKPAALKSLNSKNLLHDFRFELYKMDGDNKIPLMDGVSQRADSFASPVAFTLKSGVDENDVLNFVSQPHIFSTGEAEILVGRREFFMKEIPQDLGDGYGFDLDARKLVVEAYNVYNQPNLKILIKDGAGKVLSDNSGAFTEEGLPEFKNTYGANGSIFFSADKTLIGQPLKEGQFSFALYEGAAAEPLQVATNAGGERGEGNIYTGKVIFDAITYDYGDVGEKTYRIAEVNTGLEYYGYDAAEYLVTVLIADDDSGHLTSEIISCEKKLGGVTEAADEIAFTNTYIAEPTSVQINAKKILAGRVLAEGQFRYILRVKGDGTEPGEQLGEAANAEGGEIVFEPLTYSRDDMGKIFFYEVLELNDAKAGYEYDNTVYTVAVEVLDNGDGTLGTNVVFTKPGRADDDEAVEELVFSNVYTAKGSVQFKAGKELLRMKLENGQFAFALADATGNILQTVRNAADGLILFDKIFFNQDQLGEYKYKIYETPEDQKEIIFDKAVYLLTVTVADNGDGTLDTAVTVQKESGGGTADAEQMLFVNEYTPASSVATGDAFSALRYSLLMLLSLALISMTLRRKKIKV